MSARATWKGFVKLCLVSVPVKAYTASATGGGRTHLNQLHRGCHQRIRYTKTCPVHGAVEAEEIVSGYEVSQGRSVVLEDEELDRLRGAAEHSIQIEAFVPPGSIDRRYDEGKTYYLVPDGPAGSKPYALLARAMRDAKRHGLARAALAGGREQLVLLRPLGRMLAVSTLAYAAQRKEPAQFEALVPSVEPTDEELELAGALVAAASSDETDLARYHDTYQEGLAALVEAKLAGAPLAARPVETQADVINLMDALRQSVSQAQGNGSAGKPARRKRMAPTANGRRRKKRA